MLFENWHRYLRFFINFSLLLKKGTKMKLETTFKIKDDLAKKLKNAVTCAKELSTVECSLHNKCAQVEVKLDNDSELKWAINGACCDNFKQELAKAIEEISPQL